MGDQNDGAALGGVEDICDERVCRRSVEVRGRFVRYQHQLVGREDPSQRDPCPLPAGYRSCTVSESGVDSPFARPSSQGPRRALRSAAWTA
jgi:hypothetical protein